MKPLLFVIGVSILAFGSYSYIRSSVSADEVVPAQQTTGVLHVRVLDDSNQPIDNATVSLRSVDGGVAATLNSDDAATHSYVLRLNPNDYDVVATTTEHKVASQSVTVKAGQVIDLKLVPAITR